MAQGTDYNLAPTFDAPNHGIKGCYHHNSRRRGREAVYWGGEGASSEMRGVPTNSAYKRLRGWDCDHFFTTGSATSTAAPDDFSQCEDGDVHVGDVTDQGSDSNGPYLVMENPKVWANALGQFVPICNDRSFVSTNLVTRDRADQHPPHRNPTDFHQVLSK